MSYLLLITESAEKHRSRADESGSGAYDRMLEYADDLRTRGLLIACDALKPDNEGVRLEIRGGKRSLIDGPFSESKEIIGGFFLIDCQTKAQAIEIASECPAAAWATIEVREVGICHGD